MTFKTHQEELDFLSEQGFPVNPYNQSADSLEEVWKISQSIEEKKDNLPYPIDGLVVKVDDNTLFEKLGVVGKTPRGWCAIKFKADEITTTITDVTWGVGRTGKLTPVAELEPVELAGTTVKRATLHNYKEFIEKQICLEDTLIIRKAGDIIPEVVKVLYNVRNQDNSKKVFIAPDVCPSCGTKLIKSSTEVDLICPNYETCPDQVMFRLSYYAGKNIADIRGLSEKIIQKMMEKFDVHDIPDLYDLPYEKIQELEGFGEKSISNLESSVEAARGLSDYKFLAGLGIDGVGSEVAKLILDSLPNLESEKSG